MSKKLLYRLLSIVSFVLASVTITSAQLSQGGTPIGLKLEKQAKVRPVEFVVMPTFDMNALLKEDEVNDRNPDKPFRFGQNLHVNLNPSNSGVWDVLEDGSRLWRLGITSKGAKTINMAFNQFHLPKGARLFVYTPDGKEVIGAFTDANNQNDGYFATTLLKGDAVVVEYIEPALAEFRGEINLWRVTHGYRGVRDMLDKAFGESGSCNLNVACPQAEGWENQIRAVGMLVTGGNGFCSGSLINNTQSDGKPYFISANHCYQDASTVVFWFNWQSETCSNPPSSPSYNSLSGAVTRARNTESDFWLMELNTAPPVEYNPYYAGWNRTLSDLSETIIGIHHPSGDIKKFSYAEGGVQAANYLGNPGSGTSHWRITWSGGTATEPGSSGSPIYDSQGRFIGQLHGGYSACGNTDPDYYGRFGISWTGGGTSATRLSDWLDPTSSGVEAIEGFDPVNTAETDAPAAVANFVATPGELGALSATLNWTNPTLTFGGEPLTELTGINIYRNDVLVHTVTSPVIGDPGSYTDSDITGAGSYTYVVKPENSAGEGPWVRATIYVGEDVPGQVQNIALVDQSNKGYLSWEAPVEGMHGGYYDPTSLIEYRITRHPDNATFTVAAPAAELLDETLPGIGYYSYTIVPVNDVGEGKPATSASVLLASEGAVFMGNGSVTTCDGTFFDSGGPDANYSNSENYTLTFNPETPGAKIRFQFTSFNVESGYDYLHVYDGPDTDAPLVGEFSGDGVPALLTDITSTHASGAMTFQFISDGSVNKVGWQATVSCFIPADNDLMAVSLTGTAAPTVGLEATYTVSVRNVGSLAQLGTGYSIDLRNALDDAVLVTVPGVDLEPDALAEIPIAWTPTTEGNMSIYAYVNFAGDANPDDNATSPKDINVLPEGELSVTIGTDPTLADVRIPFDFYYRNSFSQTLYFPDEIGVGGGIISAISYDNNFVSNLADKQVKIWMGETDATDLSGGWIDFSTLTLVFDGTADFPGGANTIYIPLDNPYIYTGGNLVIYTSRVFENDYFSSSDKFYGTLDDGSNRTRLLSTDTEVDPASPGTGGTSHWLPNTTLYIFTEGLGAIEGNVTDGANPLEGVKVSIEGTMQSALTNASGDYSFPYIMAGTYNMEFSKFGYDTLTVEDVVIQEDLTTTQDAALTAIPTWNVTGVVHGSDESLLEGATVQLTGYAAYEVQTIADGSFAVGNVYQNNTYQLTISYPGFESYTGEITVETADLDLGTIVLNEIAYPVSSVIAEVIGDNAKITWGAPVSADAYFEDSFEDGTFNAWGEYIQGPGTPGTDDPQPYWFVTDIADGDVIPDGSYLARANWGYNIDTWLISPDILVNTGAGVTFSWYSSYFWSVDPNPNAELMVKVSTDGGSTWDVIWNWQDIGVWENFTWYETTVPLDAYVGQVVKVAFNLVGNDNAETQIDKVSIGIPGKFGTFAISSTPKVETNSKLARTKVSLAHAKSLETYTVYRLLEEDMLVPGNWVELASGISAATMEYLDEDWITLPEGVYKYAVEAVYTNDLISSPSFSNTLAKDMTVPVTINVSTNSGDSPEGAMVTLTNHDGIPDHIYSQAAPANGVVVFEEVWKGDYDLHVALAAFEPYDSANITIENAYEADVELIEIIESPFALMVNVDNEARSAVFSWNNIIGESWTESFESGAIPGGWNTVVTDNTATWQIVQTITFSDGDVVPQDGSYQAHLMWSYNHQDEWLITKEFVAPAGNLVFWYYGHNGSTNGDHYYVKVSEDGGSTWSILWDASTLPEADNYYQTPAVIDITAYAGKSIKLAWQNVDGDGAGLWYAWFIDKITVGGDKIDVRDMMHISNSKPNIGINQAARDGKFSNPVNPVDMLSTGRFNKSFTGYNVYLDNELVTPEPITGTAYTFTILDAGEHLASVQSVYSSGVSDTVGIGFSVAPTTFMVTFSVVGSDSSPIENATITFNDVEYSTNAQGKAFITGISNGTYQYEVAKATYDVVSGEIVVNSSDIDVAVTLILTGVGTETLSNLKAYPNPFTDRISISNPDAVKRVIVTNLIGKRIMDFSLNGQKYFSTQELPNGVYMVTLEGANGDRTVRKMVKQ